MLYRFISNIFEKVRIYDYALRYVNIVWLFLKCDLASIFSNPNICALQKIADVSNFQPVNSDLRLFREKNDVSVKSTVASVEV